MRAPRTLLIAGLMVPLVYFATLAISAWLTPDYSHLSRYASELGMAGSPSARLFNGGILLTAIATIAASVGLWTASRQISSSRVWPVLTGLSLGLFGVGLCFGAIFPMPDPRHGAFGLGMAIHGAPLFLALALRHAPDLRNLTRFLVTTTVLALLFLLVMMGIGEVVTQSNVGLYQRLYALVIFGWIGISSFALRRSNSPRF